MSFTNRPPGAERLLPYRGCGFRNWLSQRGLCEACNSSSPPLAVFLPRRLAGTPQNPNFKK